MPYIFMLYIYIYIYIYMHIYPCRHSGLKRADKEEYMNFLKKESFIY